VSAAKAVEGLLSLSFPNSQNIEQEGEEVCGKSQFESSDVKALLVLFIESDKKVGWVKKRYVLFSVTCWFQQANIQYLVDRFCCHMRAGHSCRGSEIGLFTAAAPGTQQN